MPLALIVEDEAGSRDALAALIEVSGFEVETAASLGEARAALASGPDVVLCDLGLPDGHGTELLRELEDEPGVEFIVVTGKATVGSAVEALRCGAYDYLTKPVDVQRLESVLGQLRRTLELKDEVSALRRELRSLGRFGDLVGRSKPMQRVYDLIERGAPTSAAVLITGESGTGKELAAETVYRLSKRRHESFLPINCGAISPNLVESELFGHEKGSFTGAGQRHRGFFERAHGGTLFLDEITETPVELQVKLLRVLETGLVRRVGGDQPVEADVRLIAATNRRPEEAIADGKLREDLFYRLNVFPIQLPPLSDRGEDVSLLAKFFLSEINSAESADKRLSSEALAALGRYSWPGNVRELKNVVNRAFILADGDLELDCLPAEISGESPPRGPSFHLRVGASIADAERRLILATLEQLDGDKRRASEMLGVSLKTLYNRLHDYSGGDEAEDDEAEDEGASGR